MKKFIQNNQYFIIFLVSFLIAEIIVNPIGNFPLNDDWSYAFAVQNFDKTGRINIGSFPAMTLCSHIVWGWLFAKLLGFSFFVFRISTITSAIIGFIYLNKLTVMITNNKIIGLITCLSLLFNPIFFSLSNTFMTDVNFNTLCIICCYLIYNFFVTGKLKYYVFFVLASVTLTLVRQYGIIFPVCFFLASFWSKDKKGMRIILSIFSIVITGLVLRIFEAYLRKQLSIDASYKFSGNIHFTQLVFWQNFIESFVNKHKEIVQHVLVYSSPLALLFLRSVIKQTGF